MLEIWFDNGPITGESPMCQCPNLYWAFSIYDALCRKYECVIMYTAEGTVWREYDNRPK